MATSPYKNFSRGGNTTPNSEALPGQSRNNAGGNSFVVDDWSRLTRFLILGSEGGTYYVSQDKLTRQNAKIVDKCLAADAQRTVNEIVDVSTQGRAVRQQPAIFALALAAASDDLDARRAAYGAIEKVCRTGTTLFTFLGYVSDLRGSTWSTGLNKAIARWYNDKSVEDVAYQAIKYRQREGWTHADALRVSHARGNVSKDRDTLYKFITHPDEVKDKKLAKHDSLARLEGYRQLQTVKSPQKAAELITEYKLPWEALPTELHNNLVVWEAIFNSGQLGLTAMIRQLPRLTNLGFIKSHKAKMKKVLTSEESLKRARVHPLFLLNALNTYSAGRGRGSTTWTPDRAVIDMLDAAFYASFGFVTPTGKRTVLGLDVSGSMMAPIANMSMSARTASAALALVTANVESDYEIVGFSHDCVPLTISPRQRMDDVMRATSRIPFGWTEPAKLFEWATAAKIEADTFVVYTDSETNAGAQPTTALKNYRQKSGINAKLVVVGMTSTGFTLADPKDAGMLDVVGFDTSTPELISSFSRGDF